MDLQAKIEQTLSQNYYIDITVKVYANSPEEAWEKANEAASLLNGMDNAGIEVEEVSDAA